MGTIIAAQEHSHGSYSGITTPA